MTTLLHAPGTRPGQVLDLRAHGARIAVRTATEQITYEALADRVDDAARRLGDTRRLVLVEGTNSLESLTSYLAALTHGHVVLLAPPGRPAGALAEAWDPDREHHLHPDLALLLSTSGSTGSPKLVRLSHDNLRSNAAAIADYLGLTDDDRAITSLPMHYCYGLSVINSHLLTGAGVILTDHSVVDECFWTLAAEAGATSFAGVPYTFDLLERSGFVDRDLTRLRQVTQAGGRLTPERVRHWHAIGRRAGWDLFVMYGQTEATARMAWLPPDLAETRPEAIGTPIPGGHLRLDPVPDDPRSGVGELVYTGPNVMMGYAEEPGDLALGPILTELRTGDLGRHVDGLFEVVGRCNRSAKLFGVRLDLDHLERLVATSGTEVRCLAIDDTLHAFTTRRRAGERLRGELSLAAGLPTSAIRVSVLETMPRTAAGKPDHAALADHARLLDRTAADTTDVVSPESLRDDYARLLGRPDAGTEDSFVSLAGDSLSYVELATRLTDRLGELPPDWHTRSIAGLAGQQRSTRRGVRLDTSVLLRAIAILAIVGSHAGLYSIVGGAHVLLAVAGWNFARFQLASPTRSGRVRHGLSSLAQLVLPASLWIGAVALATGFYSPATTAFLNGLLGSDGWTVQWQFWFLEALVWVTVASLAVVAVPWVDRLERRAPYRFALGLVLAGLALRFGWVGLHAGTTERYTIGVVAWWFLLGWAATHAETPLRRWTVTALAALGTVGFFGDPWREAMIVGGIALLVHVRTVRVPRLLVPLLSVIASASLFVYLTHWQVYPHLEDAGYPALAVVASFAVGIGYWRLSRPVLRRLGGLLAIPCRRA